MSNDELPSESMLLPTPQISIANSYNECIACLKDLIVILNRRLGLDDRYADTVVTRALDEYGRLRTWGEETRASLTPASRGSLDDVLRKDEELKDTVVGILAKMNRQVQFAISNTESLNQVLTEPEGKEEDDDDSDLSDDTTSSIESDQHQKMPKMFTMLRHIGNDLDSLSQVSVLIKRPGFNRRYLHSTGNSQFDARVTHFAHFDLLHVEEKFQSFENCRKVIEEDEKVTTPEKAVQRHSSDGDTEKRNVLVRRLSTAITKRREQLLYWSHHPDQTPSKDESISPEKRVTADSGKFNDKTEAELGQQRVVQPARSAQSEAPRSMVTRNTFSTVAASDVFGTPTVAGPARTIYAESTVGNKRSNKVPDVPRAALTKMEFECPYCHLMLDSKQMLQRQEWKRHVFRDLRPYICTFEHCQSPDKQYLTRHDWRYHEMQMHRRQWVCEEHSTIFSSPDLFVNHLKEMHSESVSLAQMPIMVEMSERLMDDMAIVKCPLCPDERRLVLLYSHIAEHLEAISLFALPLNAGADDMEEEKSNSRRVADGDLSSRMKDSALSKLESGFDSDPEEGLQKRNTLKSKMKAAVLIIRWNQGTDGSLTNDVHIDRLQSIFRDQFGYVCRRHSILSHSEPQEELNLAILNHISEFDDSESTLIFVYVGWAKHVDCEGVLLLADKTLNSPVALWRKAEEAIMYNMKGDAFVILDRCRVSPSHLTSTFPGLPLTSESSQRIYQVLTAFAPESAGNITSEIASSLEKLFSESKEKSFSVEDLWKKLNTLNTGLSVKFELQDRLLSFGRSVAL